ncbi:MAG: hypothetical protein QHC90_13300 [Shinella sp.]|nr:hypothetical protein [Shinella sp.]
MSLLLFLTRDRFSHIDAAYLSAGAILISNGHHVPGLALGVFGGLTSGIITVAVKHCAGRRP